MRLQDELVCKFLKVLIRNLDLQNGLCCIKQKENNLLKTDSLKTDRHALWIKQCPLAYWVDD